MTEHTRILTRPGHVKGGHHKRSKSYSLAHTHHSSQSRHPLGMQQASGSGGGGWTTFLILLVICIPIFFFGAGKRTRSGSGTNNANKTLNDAVETNRIAEMRKAAELQEHEARMAVELQRQQAIWDQASHAAEAPYTGSLLLHAGEIVGYATEVQRIVTQKVGRRSDHTSSHTSTSSGSSNHRSAGSSVSQGAGLWGVHQGASASRNAGTGDHISEHSSSGSSHGYSEDDIRTEVVDTGQLVLTNQRVVFQGDASTIEIPATKIIGFHFTDSSALVVDYARRPKGECFVVKDPLALNLAMSRRLQEPGFEAPPRPQ